jgi:hypothetical protein
LKLLLLLLLSGAATCQAVDLKISAEALERTLKTQLFATETGRYYVQGNTHSACYAYAQDPSVSFVNDRIVVRVHAHARLGTGVGGSCLGVGFNPVAAVSMVPVAEGETIGFKDGRMEQISDSRELNFLLKPFLNHKVPSSLKVNAANILRELLARSLETTGYRFSLDHLAVESMQVVGNSLVVQLNGSLSVK